MFDLFISYASADRPAARMICQGLRKRGLRIFFDEDDLTSGMPVMDALTRTMLDSKGVLLLLGAKQGPWQTEEIRLALDGAITGKRRVFPCLLPGTRLTDLPDELAMLRTRSVHPMRAPLDHIALDELYETIMGRKPPEREERIEESAGPEVGSPLRIAVTTLCGIARSGPMTFYLGDRVVHGALNQEPNTYQVSHHLLRGARVIDLDYHHHLPTSDIAGLYYAAETRGGAAALEAAVCEVLNRQGMRIPDTCRNLAELLKRLAARKEPLRGRAPPPQLVVTTNIDLWMERALIGARLPFTRVVQCPAPNTDEVEWYVTVLDGNSLLGVPDVPPREDDPDWTSYLRILDQVLDQAGGTTVRAAGGRSKKAGLRLDKYTQPILYKYHGSQDVSESCTISTDQYIDFTERNEVPAGLQTTVAGTPAVFLGYRLLDPTFRHLYGTLLRRCFRTQLSPLPKFMICAPAEPFPQANGGANVYAAYEQMEKRNWQLTQTAAADAGITALGASPADFLSALDSCLEGQDGAG